MAEIKVMTKDIKVPVARIEQAEPQVEEQPVEEAVDSTSDVAVVEPVLGEPTATPDAETNPAPSPEPAPVPTESSETSAQAPAQQGIIAKWLSARFPGREHTAVGGLCGLALALLIFTIGLWRTLVIVGFVAVGAVVGSLLDAGWKPFGWVRRLRGRRQR